MQSNTHLPQMVLLKPTVYELPLERSSLRKIITENIALYARGIKNIKHPENWRFPSKREWPTILPVLLLGFLIFQQNLAKNAWGKKRKKQTQLTNKWLVDYYEDEKQKRQKKYLSLRTETSKILTITTNRKRLRRLPVEVQIISLNRS